MAINEALPFGSFVVRIFERDAAGQWVASAALEAPTDLNASQNASFGRTFELDGVVLVARVTAHQAAQNMVIVYEKRAGVWQEATRLLAPSYVQANRIFAMGGVALSGDTIAVGSVSATGLKTDGVVHVFVRQGRSWVLQQVVEEPQQVWNEFASAVELHGDHLAVNASAGDAGTRGVCLFERNAGVWSQQNRLVPPNVNSYFGQVMVMDGERLAVADVEQKVGNAGYNNYDVVHIFELDGAGQWQLDTRRQTDVAHRGNPLALVPMTLRGDRVLIGEYFTDQQILAGEEPGVSFFERGAQGWSAARGITPFDWATGRTEEPSVEYGYMFGNSLAFDDEGRAFVGALGDRLVLPLGINMVPPGAVYLLTDSLGLFCDGFQSNPPRCDGQRPD